MSDNKDTMTERRSYSIYLRKNEIEAVDRLKQRFMRENTTDLIRFLIKAADGGFLSPDFRHNENATPARTKRAANP